MDFIEPCFGIGHNLSLICQMTSEDIKHQLIIIMEQRWIVAHNMWCHGYSGGGGVWEWGEEAVVVYPEVVMV